MKANKLNIDQARNESLAAAKQAKGIDKTQAEQAGLGTQELMQVMNLRAHKRIAETEAHHLAQGNSNARKDLLDLGKA
ncbi:MAG: hypothetical protein OXU45_00040 [Candidatus Melainabacteria bacterium]|nr:hypothetical protein [Candidatus Melainabacteria bacterium]